jgi:hypothetical protein
MQMISKGIELAEGEKVEAFETWKSSKARRERMLREGEQLSWISWREEVWVIRSKH